MLKWILPREGNFFDFFERHAALIILASQKFLTWVTNGLEESEWRKIKEYEHAADEITHHCVEELHKTFITPFDRNDIFRLISKMDDVIDFIENAAARVETYKLRTPTPEVEQMAKILVQTSLQIEKAVKTLRHLKKNREMQEASIEINHLENEADSTLRNAIGRLFEEESDIRLLIKWKEIYESLENAIDCCEDVSNIIEGVLLESE